MPNSSSWKWTAAAGFLAGSCWALFCTRNVTLSNADKVLSPLGVATSLATIALSRIAERPAMSRLRTQVVVGLALLWFAIILCLLQTTLGDVSGPFDFVSGWLKCGLVVWVGGLVFVLWLLRLSLVSQHHLYEFPFGVGELKKFELSGAPMGSRSLEFVRQCESNNKVIYPIVLSADRGVSGLEIGQRFLLAALAAPKTAMIVLTITRPSDIDQLVQCAKKLVELNHLTLDAEISDLEKAILDRLIVIDGFTPLHLRARPWASKAVHPNVRHVETTAPDDVLAAYKRALVELRKSWDSVRVLYDSFADMMVIADKERSGAFFRHVTVFDERYRVESLYLTWQEVKEMSISEEYISRSSNTYVSVKRESDEAVVEVGHASLPSNRARMSVEMEDPKRQANINLRRIQELGDFARAADNEAKETVGDRSWGETERWSEFLFLYCAFDHLSPNTSEADRTAPLSVTAARDLFERNGKRDWWADVLSDSRHTLALFGSTKVPPDAEFRVHMVRDAALFLADEYKGRVSTLLEESKSRLRTPDGKGVLQRLRKTLAYSDPAYGKAYRFTNLCLQHGCFELKEPEPKGMFVNRSAIELALRLGIVDVTDRILSCMKDDKPIRRVDADILRGDCEIAFQRLCERVPLDAMALDAVLLAYQHDLLSKDLLSQLKPARPLRLPQSWLF